MFRLTTCWLFGLAILVSLGSPVEAQLLPRFRNRVTRSTPQKYYQPATTKSYSARPSVSIAPDHLVITEPLPQVTHAMPASLPENIVRSDNLIYPAQTSGIMPTQPFFYEEPPAISTAPTYSQGMQPNSSFEYSTELPLSLPTSDATVANAHWATPPSTTSEAVVSTPPEFEQTNYEFSPDATTNSQTLTYPRTWGNEAANQIILPAENLMEPAVPGAIPNNFGFYVTEIGSGTGILVDNIPSQSESPEPERNLRAAARPIDRLQQSAANPNDPPQGLSALETGTPRMPVEPVGQDLPKAILVPGAIPSHSVLTLE